MKIHKKPRKINLTRNRITFTGINKFAVENSRHITTHDLYGTGAPDQAGVLTTGLNCSWHGALEVSLFMKLDINWSNLMLFYLKTLDIPYITSSNRNEIGEKN